MKLALEMLTFAVRPTSIISMSLVQIFTLIVVFLFVCVIQTPLPCAEEPAKGTPPPSKGAAETDAQGSRQKEAEETERLTDLFLRQQNVFLRKRELMVELNSFYSRNEQQRFVQTGPAQLSLARLTTRLFDETIVLRYGILTDGLELDVFAPVFVHAEQHSDFGTQSAKAQENRFGDLSAALRYQVWYERGLRPSLTLDIEGKSRTGGSGLAGTGNWNAGGGITLLKSIDPVVFFGRLGYTHNFRSSTLSLGDSVDYRVGMGFSLNDRVSFTIQITGAIISPGEQKILLPGTGLTPDSGLTAIGIGSREIMNLFFTTTVLVTKRFFIEPVVGVALTDQAFTIIGIRIPYRFPAF
jgi:hypothetical protein